MNPTSTKFDINNITPFVPTVTKHGQKIPQLKKLIQARQKTMIKTWKKVKPMKRVTKLKLRRKRTQPKTRIR